MDNTKLENLQVLNKNSLKERMLNDEELIRDILSVFLEDTPVQIEKIKNALKNSDFENVRDAAHSLKGAAANIAAELLQVKAKEIEYASRDKQIEILPQLISEAEKLFSELKSEIQKYIDGVIQ